MVQKYLNASELAARIGVSTKALKLYEQHGLLAPQRTAAGWRTYGAAEIDRAREIAMLRQIGLSLAQTGRVLAGDPRELEPALAAHQARLAGEVRELNSKIERVHTLRIALTQGQSPAAAELMGLVDTSPAVSLSLDLPWPWAGERFELESIAPINYIVGPLGSGKTRLAEAIAAALPNATFLGLNRLDNGAAEALALLQADSVLKKRVECAMTWLEDDGATTSPALISLLIALQSEAADALVIDMIEQGLDRASQEALIAWLRRREPDARQLFLMTRSSAILDPAGLLPGETIIYCPANHSPPMRVAPYPGSAGYEALATCLASPDVRARTDGVIAMRPAFA